jgi:DNA-binding NtrC family response regulator
MQKPTILIAGEENRLSKQLKERLLQHGFDVIEASVKTSVLKMLQNGIPELAIIGPSQENGRDGVTLAEQIRRQHGKLPIILLTRQSSEARVLKALKTGVADYFTVPFSYDELVTSVKYHLRTPYKTATTQTMPADSTPNHSTQPIIGQSSCICRIKDYLLKVAATDSTVLVTGETGTGKELVAESIHRNSPRHYKPFVCINCAALPESLVESELFGYDRGAFTGASVSRQGGFEQANGGTVFLDEIGDMSASAQVKILRAIERKEVHHLGGKKVIALNVRVISATNHDPEALIQEGMFRPDLYYRLNVARIHLPPLRERKEDIPRLIAHYIHEFNRRFGREVEGLTEEALELLLYYGWPGNVRELKNLLEATFINLPSRKIRLMDLPEIFQRRLKETEGLPQSERDLLLSALFATNWNKSKAAEKLHWSRMTLYRKMAKYDIKE